ncbi:IS1 family transposase [Endozoicomonas montiporae]|uniref:IS1 family transposase n=1 Tax=Endozoicomonas montiporae TaxID=1027273 RepID=UPI003B83042F
MCLTQVLCTTCGSNQVRPFGYSTHDVPRYYCCNDKCEIKTFMLEYRYKACEPGVKEKIIDMAINGSGIRDTSKVLGISKTTVIKTLKKMKSGLVKVNPNIQTIDLKSDAIIHVGLVCQEAELDEQWSYVHDKSNQRWLWYAVDHATNTVLAYVFGKRKDEVFKELKTLLKPFGINKFYTDDWGAYERHLDENMHIIGKANTQKIERKNLNFRTWIKRLARKTICFSKLEKMHDIVIGLLINKVEFGVNIHAI